MYPHVHTTEQLIEPLAKTIPAIESDGFVARRIPKQI